MTQTAKPARIIPKSGANLGAARLEQLVEETASHMFNCQSLYEQALRAYDSDAASQHKFNLAMMEAMGALMCQVQQTNLMVGLVLTALYSSDDDEAPAEEPGGMAS